MRVTKKMLERQIEGMEQYLRLRPVQINPNDEFKLRDVPGFVPVCQYAYPCAEGEVGILRDQRIFIGKIDTWKP